MIVRREVPVGIINSPRARPGLSKTFSLTLSEMAFRDWAYVGMGCSALLMYCIPPTPLRPICLSRPETPFVMKW